MQLELHDFTGPPGILLANSRGCSREQKQDECDSFHKGSD
jgi:hypothetical protein